MKDFNIAKYLKENKLGPHAILSNYVDLKPLKEVSEEEMYGTVPYEGPDPKLDGFGDEFDQVDPVEEGFSEEQDRFDRMMGLINSDLIPKLPKVKNIVDQARDKGLSDMAIFNMLSSNPSTSDSISSLVDDGFDPQDIVDFFATDFSLGEEVTVSSSGVEMGGDDIPVGTEFFDNEEGLTRSGYGTITKYYQVTGKSTFKDPKTGETVVGWYTAKPIKGGMSKDFPADHIKSHPIKKAY